MVETTPAREVPIAKPVITAMKTEKRGKKMVTPTMQRESLACTICDVIGHPTHICPELDELKPLLGSETDIAMLRSRKKEPTTKGKGKALHTNHACTLCNNFGHYTHHFFRNPMI